MILLNIGSNINSGSCSRVDNIKDTITLLKEEDVKVIKVSSFYETPSYPNNSHPKYLNVALQIEFNQNPNLLLKKILFIEKQMGRIRKKKNEPRVCDIDIIDFNSLKLNSEKLILPHPKAHERNFVLIPLMEICSDWVHPKINKKIDILIDNLGIKRRNEITRIK
jgi:2-amino-4-hydroxy-6-hydroxymethyldihydropteridine diphosphokinase